MLKKRLSTLIVPRALGSTREQQSPRGQRNRQAITKQPEPEIVSPFARRTSPASTRQHTAPPFVEGEGRWSRHGTRLESRLIGPCATHRLPNRQQVQPRPAATAACFAALLLPVGSLWQGPHAATQSAPAAMASKGTAYAITPRRQALLNTIRYAEGTWKNGSGEGYHTLYGGGRFASLARHPEIVVVKRYTSAAAGAYQFLPGTWREASRRLQLASFRPENQDQAALYLVDRRGVLKEIDQRGLTPRAMSILAKEWASFPTANGHSAYGQPVKPAIELERFYQASLETSQAGSPQTS